LEAFQKLVGSEEWKEPVDRTQIAQQEMAVSVCFAEVESIYLIIRF
jgi:hypothetical protein